MIPIANAQNEFKSILIANCWLAYVRKINGEMHGKLKMAHFDPTAKRKQSRGDLVTDKEYSNFHLKLDWKVAPKQIAE
jgi:hypothetical protein